MKDFNRIGEDLFDKLRGRFQEMIIGDEEGNVTNEPSSARFFDFEYSDSGSKLGKVSVSIDEDDGLTVIYSRDFIQNEDEMTQKNWYNFLRELRKFSKKRLLNFDVRDINKSNLTKRDYKFLATNRPEDITMTESKLYGTGRISYQNIDNARLVIKHTESIDQTNPSARTRKIGSIYIESAEGERFKYPYKHVSGARAMARHVAEGGTPYDDFGSHITGLSEEMSKLRKFKNYMGRSTVMAESLEGYMDIVKERISTVKKTIESLQKPNYYRETFDSFETPMFEDVPEDVAENWVDQLTIRQFNEELADVFPYIYNLVKEGTKTTALGPDDLLGEAANDCDETCPKSCPDCGGTGDPEQYKKDKEVDEAHGNSKEYDKCWDDYRKVPGKTRGSKGSCVKEEDQLEELFNQSMGQFAEATIEHGNLYVKFRAKNSLERDENNKPIPYLTGFADFAQEPDQVKEKTALRKFTALTNMKAIANAIKKLMSDKVFVSAKKIILYRDSPGLENKFPQLKEFYDWMSSYGGDKIAIEEPVDDPDKPEREKGVGKKQKPKGYYAANPKDYDIPDKKMTRYFTIDNGRLFNFLRREMPDFMQKHFRPNFGGFIMKDKDYKQFIKFINSEKVIDQYGKTNIDIDNEKSFVEDKVEQEQKTPLGEFILSYFDRGAGQFPKGETAILTMVEKDYGEEFIEPAKAFIEQVNNKVAEVMGFREPEIQEDDFEEGYKVLPPIDTEKYQERSGLEGPFSTLSGKVVYYDPKEGSYYDPDTDFYISYDDFQKLDKDYSNMKDNVEYNRMRELAGLR